MLKHSIIGIFIFLASWSALPAQSIHRVWDPRFRSGIAAEVEDRIITFQDVWREMQPLEPQIRAESMTADEYEKKMARLYVEILQELTDNVLIIKEFEEKEYQIPDSAIKNRFDEILIQRFNNDRQLLLEHLQQIGKTLRDFRKSIREEIIVRSMRYQQREKEASISPEKIEEFYKQNKIHFFQEEQVNLGLIMIKAMADEGQDVLRQQAEQVIKELNNGLDFAEAAAKYSQDSKKTNGGSWGWVSRSELRLELSEVAFNLQPGSFSEPVSLAGQFYILKVDEKKPEGIKPLEDVRDEIEETLAAQLSKREQKRWLERLRKDAYVKYY